MTRADALVALLAIAPAADLVGIGYRYTLPRHPPGLCGLACQRTVSSDPDMIRRDLGTAYVTWRRQDWGQDISCVVSKRTVKLRMVRRERESA